MSRMARDSGAMLCWVVRWCWRARTTGRVTVDRWRRAEASERASGWWLGRGN